MMLAKIAKNGKPNTRMVSETLERGLDIDITGTLDKMQDVIL